MSRINVENIRHPDASSDSLQLSDTGNITAPGNLSVTGTSTLTGDTTVTGSLTANGVAYPSAGPLSNRNLIINGAMQVAQRGTSSTDVGAQTLSFPALDRFRFLSSGTAGRMTVSQDSDAPDGFGNSMKLDVTTADTSIDANDFFGFRYQFEGQDLQMLKKGTSAAEQVTVSFWVKGNAAATYTIELQDVDNARSNTQTFSVTTSWNRLELTFAGDTTGEFNDDNNSSLWINFWVHAGSTYSSGTFTSNTWESRAIGNIVRSTDTSIFDSTDRTLFITGLQMEVGEVATPFEHRSYGDELARCQRYYQKLQSTLADSIVYVGYNAGTTSSRGTVYFPVSMRKNPTAVETTGTASDYNIRSGGSTTTCNSVPSFEFATTQSIGLQFNVSSGLTADAVSMCRFAASDAFLAWEAEL